MTSVLNMAAPTSSTPSIRIRLIFSQSCKHAMSAGMERGLMCWYLVDRKVLHRISDVVRAVDSRFCRGSRGLSLWLEDCLLPPWESVDVLRDNDTVTVRNDFQQLDSLDGIKPSQQSDKGNRKHKFWDSFGVSILENNEELEPPRKRKKRRNNIATELPPGGQTENECDISNLPKRHKKKKHKRVTDGKYEPVEAENVSDKEADLITERKHKHKTHKEESECKMTKHVKKKKKHKNKEGDVSIARASHVENVPDVVHTSIHKKQSEGNNLNIGDKAVDKSRESDNANMYPKSNLGVSTPKTGCSEIRGNGGSQGKQTENNTIVEKKKRRRRKKNHHKSQTQDNVPAVSVPPAPLMKNNTKIVPGRAVRLPKKCGASGEHKHFNSDNEHDGEGMETEPIMREESSVLPEHAGLINTVPEIGATSFLDATLPIQTGKTYTLGGGNLHSTPVYSEGLMATPDLSPVQPAGQSVPFHTQEQLPQDQRTNFNKPKKINKRSQPNPTAALFAGAQVFDRRKNKKSSFYALTKAEQLNTVATNKSVILQNQSLDLNEVIEPQEARTEPEPQPNPARDYSSLQMLHDPPRVGDHIAFKLLEMSTDYTPEISDYKEGEVVAYDPSSQKLQVRLTSTKTVRNTEGKFEVRIENDEEVLTNAAEDDLLCVVWSTIVEARLIVEPKQTAPNTIIIEASATCDSIIEIPSQSLSTLT